MHQSGVSLDRLDRHNAPCFPLVGGMNGLLATMRRRYVVLPTLSCISANVHLGRHAVASDFVGYEVDPLDMLKSAPSSFLWPSVNSSSAVFCSSINCNEYLCMRHRELRVHDSLLHSIIAYASFPGVISPPLYHVQHKMRNEDFFTTSRRPCGPSCYLTVIQDFDLDLVCRM